MKKERKLLWVGTTNAGYFLPITLRMESGITNLSTQHFSYKCSAV